MIGIQQRHWVWDLASCWVSEESEIASCKDVSHENCPVETRKGKKSGRLLFSPLSSNSPVNYAKICFFFLSLWKSPMWQASISAEYLTGLLAVCCEMVPVWKHHFSFLCLFIFFSLFALTILSFYVTNECQYSDETVNEVLLVILLGGHELKQASESYLILNASAGLAHTNSFISDKQILLVLSSL